MTDEEKQAIDNMKSLLLYSKEHEHFSPFQEQEIDDMNIVLNLIEKQSKEIKGLIKVSKECIEEKFNNDKKWEDKIKAKIEEIKQRREKDGECELALHGFQREAKIEVLQSLLEKE